MAWEDPSTLLESFIQQILVLSQDSSYIHLKNVLNDNRSLKDRNHILSITNDENHRTISKLQQQLDDSARRGQEQDERLAALAEENSLIGEKTALLESAAEAARTQLSELTVQVAELQAELADKTVMLENARSEFEHARAQLEESRGDCTALQADVDLRASQVEDLKTGLEEKKEELAASQAANDESSVELRSAREDLEVANTRLGELDALSFRMKNPPQEQTRQQLRDMFTATYRWAEEFFGVDLGEDVFMTPASGITWAKIRNHGRVSRVIPLPLSNTSAAKHMRISAAISIAGWSLARYIFQPTYLLQCNELSDLLADLADDDPLRQNYLRSVLLPVLPSKQKANGRRRIEQFVLEVFACVSPVLPDRQHEALKSSLETMCKEVCGQWMRLQLLDEKIEPNFDAYDEEDWRPVSLPSSDGSTDVDAEKAVAPAGTAVGDEATNESAIVDGDSCDGVSDIEDIAAVLWPSFLSFHNGESELLTEGFVLTKDQVRPAYGEEKAALLQGIHRAARQISRKDRTRSFATSVAGTEEVRSLVKDFLPSESDGPSVEPSAPASASGDPVGAEANTETDPDPNREEPSSTVT